MDDCSLFWFRRDLRFHDHPALTAAVKNSRAVIPVFIWSPGEEGEWAPGAASRWWLHQSLGELDRGLRKKGSRLVLRRGDCLGEIRTLLKETGAASIYWSRCYEPVLRHRDETLARALRAQGVSVRTFNASVLFEPWSVETGSGMPYKVYTAFWNNCMAGGVEGRPVAAVKKIQAPLSWPGSLALESLGLEPEVDWAQGIRKAWSPGESGALRALLGFIREKVSTYSSERDRPDHHGTSRLSAHLHFGEISPRTLWNKIPKGAKSKTYLRQLIWREFAHHLLYHFPGTPLDPLRESFRAFPWERDEEKFRAWKKGMTGYPIVDAGMRELWATGWMHNRVRMIVGSFLVKDLRISWQDGARWFWDTLVDADLANNTLGWQWVAGCGADAAPYFRIFNPVLQGQRFDPSGDYVRQWIPELGKLPAQWIHRPWQAPARVLSESDVWLGKNYPEPIIDHGVARKRALLAWSKIRRPDSKGA